MSRENGVPSAPAVSPSLSEALEPTKAALLDLWMGVADGRRALETSVQELRHQGDNPVLKTMETELERMDSLIFDSMEKTDELFTLIYSDIESRKASTEAPGGRVTGTALVDELDAYLDGAYDRLERPPRKSTATQTDAAVPTSTPSPVNALTVRKDAPSIEVFDLLSKKVRAQGSRPKLQIQTDFPMESPTAFSTSFQTKTASSKKAKRRVRSLSPLVLASPMSSDSDMEDEEDGSNKETKRRRRSYSAIKGRHPREIKGFRTENGVREYAIQYGGVDQLTWMSKDNATKTVKRMIAAYNQARKKHVEDTVSAALHGTNEDGAAGAASHKPIELLEDSDSEPVYMVDKIVDHRVRHGKREYYVKWEGYDSDENTWEPASKLRREVGAIVDEYEREVAKKASRKKAKARALMRTKTEMQAKVDKLSSQLSQASGEPAASFPGKRLHVPSSKGSRSIASTEEEDEDEDEDDEMSDSQSESQDGSANERASASSDDEREIDSIWARATTILRW